jgi:hypothetical protein
MDEHDLSRSTRGRTRRPLPHQPDFPRTAEEQEEQGLTVVPPIVWTAGIAGVVAVLLLSV